jgi:hypothetical protein
VRARRLAAPVSDLVVAANPGRPNRPTELLVETVTSGFVPILAHQPNRLINEREPLNLDWVVVNEYRDTVVYVVLSDVDTVGEPGFMLLGVSPGSCGGGAEKNVLNPGRWGEWNGLITAAIERSLTS